MCGKWGLPKNKPWCWSVGGKRWAVALGQKLTRPRARHDITTGGKGKSEMVWPIQDIIGIGGDSVIVRDAIESDRTVFTRIRLPSG